MSTSRAILRNRSLSNNSDIVQNSNIQQGCCLALGAAQALLDDLPTLRAHAAGDAVGNHLLDRMNVAAEHASACAMLGDADLAAPLAVVTRALLEGIFGTYWASLHEANGRRLIEASTQELLRIMLRDLEAGHATIRDRATGEDRTAEIRRHPAAAAAKRFPRFDDMAREAGLRKLYDLLYRPMSMFTHGVGTEFLTGEQRETFIDAQLHAASALMKCGHAIVTNRICNGRVTTLAEVTALLRLGVRMDMKPPGR